MQIVHLFLVLDREIKSFVDFTEYSLQGRELAADAGDGEDA